MLASCGGADSVSRIELSSDQIDSIYANAVNNNGWQEVSPGIWAALAVEACDRGAWEHEINAEIVWEFLNEPLWVPDFCPPAARDQFPPHRQQAFIR